MINEVINILMKIKESSRDKSNLWYSLILFQKLTEGEAREFHNLIHGLYMQDYLLQYCPMPKQLAPARLRIQN